MKKIKRYYVEILDKELGRVMLLKIKRDKSGNLHYLSVDTTECATKFRTKYEAEIVGEQWFLPQMYERIRVVRL